MARGYMYYITKTKDRDVHFHSVFYNEYIDTIGAEYLSDCDETESEEPLKWLADSISNKGAAIGYGSMGDFKFSFRFDQLNQAQQDYFRPKLEKLKETVEKLTLFDVIHSAPLLDNIINNRYSDMITFADENTESTMTVDDFIRQLEPGVTYYVYKRTILMH